MTRAAPSAEAPVRRRVWRTAFADPALEEAFRRDYAERFAPTMRAASLFGAALWGSFGVLDAVVAPTTAPEFWTIRLIVLPLLLAAWAATRLPALRGSLQLVFAGYTIAASAGIVAMVALAEPPVSHVYYAGLLLVVGFGCTVARLRFPYAATAGLLTAAAYNVVALGGLETPPAVVVSNDFFLISAVGIGLFANGSMESTERQAFLRRRTIEADSRRLAELAASLEAMSIRDHLTGLFNRRHLDTRLSELLRLHHRHGTETAVLLLDLDGFKAINDTLGHPVGDAALQAVATVLRSGLLRGSDLVFRYGGDEFCVVLPHTTPAAAERILAAVREGLAAARIDGVDGPLPLDFSAGCLALSPAFQTPDDVLRALDRLLYEAKRQGKGLTISAA